MIHFDDVTNDSIYNVWLAEKNPMSTYRGT